jgi:hypothetical protein
MIQRMHDIIIRGARITHDRRPCRFHGKGLYYNWLRKACEVAI